jgi:hypothetical protein
VKRLTAAAGRRRGGGVVALGAGHALQVSDWHWPQKVPPGRGIQVLSLPMPRLTPEAGSHRLTGETRKLSESLPVHSTASLSAPLASNSSSLCTLTQFVTLAKPEPASETARRLGPLAVHALTRTIRDTAACKGVVLVLTGTE